MAASDGPAPTAKLEEPSIPSTVSGTRSHITPKSKANKRSSELKRVVRREQEAHDWHTGIREASRPTSSVGQTYLSRRYPQLYPYAFWSTPSSAENDPRRDDLNIAGLEPRNLQVQHSLGSSLKNEVSQKRKKPFEEDPELPKKNKQNLNHTNGRLSTASRPQDPRNSRKHNTFEFPIHDHVQERATNRGASDENCALVADDCSPKQEISEHSDMAITRNQERREGLDDDNAVASTVGVKDDECMFRLGPAMLVPVRSLKRRPTALEMWENLSAKTV